MIEKYCLSKGSLGCDFEIDIIASQNGGGPFFIEHYLSKKQYIEKLTPTDSVMEMCSGPGYMGYYLANEFNLSRAEFCDINPLVEESHLSNQNNNLPFDINFTQGSAFDNYSNDPVDLIILNPPHLVSEKDYVDIVKAVPEYFPTGTLLQRRQNKLVLLDKDFKFHLDFCGDAYENLTANGQIAFLENEKYIPHSRLEKALGDRYSYEFIQTQEHSIEGYYLLIATKI